MSEKTKQKAKIIKVVPFPSQDTARAGKMDAVIMYQMDGTPGSMIMLPLEDLNEAKISKAIRDQERKLEALTGREIKI